MNNFFFLNILWLFFVVSMQFVRAIFALPRPRLRSQVSYTTDLSLRIENEKARDGGEKTRFIRELSSIEWVRNM